MLENDATYRKSTFVAMLHNSRESFTTTSVHNSLNSTKVLLKVSRSGTCFRWHHNSNNSIKCKQPTLYRIALLLLLLLSLLSSSCVKLLCPSRVSNVLLFAKSTSIINSTKSVPAPINAQSVTASNFDQTDEQQRQDGPKILARSLRTITSSQLRSDSQQNERNKAQFSQQNDSNLTAKPNGCIQSIVGHSNFDSSGIWNPNLANNDRLSSEHQNYSFGYTQSRASKFVKPMFYTLRLKVDPTKRKFSGQLMITLEINSPNESSSRTVFNSNLAPATDTNSNSNSTTFSDTIRDKNGGLGYRYLTLHSGSNLNIKKVFYVFTSRGSVQIPATRIGKDLENELLTIDFYPNVITSGQGLLLIVYTGNVNEADSQGLFVHHSQKAAKRFVMIKNGSTMAIDDSGLATHMQPNFARRLLPAWDEPHLKARFNLIVVLPFRNYQSISNMPIKKKSILLSCSGESLQEIEFQTTPPMSTYLFTLVIGRFDYIESITPNNCKIRAYVYSNLTNHENNVQRLLANQQQKQVTTTATTSSSSSSSSSTTTTTTTIQQTEQASITSGINHRKQAAQMALEVAVETFDRFETLLGVKYPLNKFDMIALREFDNGGMENWGASIFHENYLLYDYSSRQSFPSAFSQDIQVNGGKSHRPRRLIIPLVVAHEIAHQWFGNLLTPHSWTYLWLNEGFAQLLMYDVANSLFPNENYWHIFNEDSRQSAMHEDELRSSSRALEFELDSRGGAAKSSSPISANEDSSGGVESVYDANNLPPAPSTSEQLNLFDQLTYNKGAMIVRMMYFLLGRKQFFASLQHYLLKHSYDTVTSHDLWLALEESTGRADMQLESQMVNWLRQEGFPVINVQVLDEPFHYRLVLTQERFQLLNDDSINQLYPPLPKIKPWSIPISISSELCPKPNEEQLILKDITKVGEQGSIMNSGSINLEENSGNLQHCSFVNFLLDERQSSVLIPKVSTGTWLKLNFNATGYFRVNYLNNNDDSLLEQSGSISSLDQSDQSNKQQGNNNQRRQANLQLQQQQAIDMLARMAAAAKDKSMCVIDRFNLVDDLFAMVKSGRQQTTYYLRYLIEAFGEETEIIVLRAIVESLRHIKLAIVSNSGPDSDSNPNSNSNPNVNVLFNSTSFDNSNLKFMSHYERYVQKYLRKVSQNIMRSVESIRSAARVKDASHQIQLRELKESEDLIGAHLIQYNDVEMVKRAADLFSKNFRHQHQQQQQQPPTALFDSMDRELRASIYSTALLGTSGNNEDTLLADSDQTQPNSPPLNDELLLSGSATTTLLRNSPPHVTTRQLSRPAQDSTSASHSSSLSSIFASFAGAATGSLVPNSPPFSSSSSSSTLSNSQLPPPDLSSMTPSAQSAAANSSTASFRMPQAAAPPNNQQTHLEVDSVFLKLLKAYETSESSNERYAICTALGSVEQANKQIELLNLTLFQNYFRPHDIISILDSMAQKSKQGRKLIWETLKANTSSLEKRKLLVPILKSLSHGLIEMKANKGQQQHVETFLRSLNQLYGEEYGKLIGQTIEIVRINTRWFHRDHDSLLKYLISSSSSSGDF